MVAAPDHPLAGTTPRLAQLREQTWLLGPSAADRAGVVPGMLRRISVAEERQRIFQSHAAALEEAKRGKGVGAGRGVRRAARTSPPGRPGAGDGRPGCAGDGVWSAMTLADGHAPPAAAELARFVSTPRATQAMLRGAGVTIGRFRPSVHVTLWS